MDTININQNLINLIASYKKTGQSDEVIKQSLWQMGMIPEMVESHLKYYNDHMTQINKDINIVKENKDMKLTLENLHIQSEKTMSALDEMKSDNSLGFSSSSAKQIIEKGMAQLQITQDDKTVMEEKIKAGYKIDEDLVNPILKYSVAENLYSALAQYDWIMPVADFRNMIAESFVSDKWSYVTANFAKAVSQQVSNAPYASLYKSLVNVLVNEDNVRLGLKNVLLENAWNKDAKSLLSTIVSEEKAEQGEVDEKIYSNSSCSLRKTFSPMLIDEDKRIFHLNGKDYIFDGKTLKEANVTDRRYLNVLEGLALLKYDPEKERLVYYGKNGMVLEYRCKSDELYMGTLNLSNMSILDINETLKKSGLFNRETASDCEKLVKLFESKDMLYEIDDPITTIQNDKIAGIYITVINVDEGVYVNKVDETSKVNEMIYCKTASEACLEIKTFMKYDATAILEDKLKAEGVEYAILESKRNAIRDNIAFLGEKRSQLIAAIQETDNNPQLQEALKLIESEIKKNEKELQETYIK